MDELLAGGGGILVSILILLFVIIVLFLILRQVAIWYWKINLRIELLKEQIRLLKKIANEVSENQTEQFVSKVKKRKMIQG